MSKEALLTRAREQVTHLSKRDVEVVWNALQDGIRAELKDGSEVMIAGVGKLKPTKRGPRTARNPRTGEPIQVPARETVGWKVSSTY